MILARFVLLIFYPGTALTNFIFAAIHPWWPGLMHWTGYLVNPITAFFEKLPFPQGILHWFPTAPVAELVLNFFRLLHYCPGIGHSQWLQRLMAVDYHLLYPGRFEWTALISLFLLSRLRDLLRWIYFYFQRLQQRMQPKSFPTANPPAWNFRQQPQSYSLPPNHPSGN